VTKSEVKDDMNNLIDRLEKLDEKIDRLFEIK
jgi:tetrahydromethanopterin S-methyltransferase subunit G